MRRASEAGEGAEEAGVPSLLSVKEPVAANAAVGSRGVEGEAEEPVRRIDWGEAGTTTRRSGARGAGDTERGDTVDEAAAAEDEEDAEGVEGAEEATAVAESSAVFRGGA